VKKNVQESSTRPVSAAAAQELWNRDKNEFELWALSLLGAKAKPYEGGTIGLLGFVESGKRKASIVVQVKGGRSLTSGMIRDLAGIVEKVGAAMGLLISLNKPTLSVITESVHAGSYESELWRRKFLKIQIRSVAELLEGKSFDIPQPYSLLKKSSAKKEKIETARLL
jgi:site-specific DNA-methyltransferase (adenine-specific)